VLHHENLMKIPVIKTEDFIIYLEDNEGIVFIHCDVLGNWNKKVKQNLLKSFDVLTKEWDRELYALHTPNDSKHEKFLKMFKFKYLTSIKGKDQSDYDIYVWR
jgi:hypothetical protein